MRHAGQVAAEVLIGVGHAIRPGVTTDEIARGCHAAYIARGAYPSTLNSRGYRKSCCTSVNEVICHGIPDSRRLVEGDVVNVDVTAFIDGVHGDTSAMFAVGEIDDWSRDLMRATRRSLDAGIDAVRPGARISDIGKAIEQSVKGEPYGIVREFIAHGIGDQFHTSLQIPHYYDPRYRTKIEPGMTFTVEPMITIGSPDLYVWDDDWTAATLSGLRSAQYEHTLLVTDDGVERLTIPADGVPAEEIFAV